MVFAVKDRKTVGKAEIDGVLSDLNFPSFNNVLASSNAPKSPILSQEKGFAGSFRSARKSAEMQDVLKKNLYKLPYDKMKIGARADELFLDKLSADDHEECLLASFAERSVEPDYYRVDKDIEEIVKEKWRYLVMQFGGVFLTEIRPNRCFMGNKTLADKLITYNKKKEEYGLDLRLLDNYLRENCNGFVQIHFSDIMFNPKTEDYDVFSVTSGEKKKEEIFFELDKFLSVYNKNKSTIIPIHLPYFEKWKTAKKVRTFGQLSENGKRDAVIRAEKVLRYLSDKFRKENIKDVKLALETGNGESKKNGHINYALIYEPHHLKFLIQGREDYISICEDVGHLNLIDADWMQYLTDEISEFHVSGNNGKEDQHTIATPNTLKDYEGIMSFLKFYSGNICAEVGRGGLDAGEFLKGVKNLAYTLFSEPEKRDFENLKKIEEHIKVTQQGRISDKNLNQERYAKYKNYTKTS